MSALLDLAARVEAASAGTRGLDRMVSEAMGRTPAPRHRVFDGPRYTASLDAALSLVPEGMQFGAGRDNIIPGPEGWAWISDDEDYAIVKAASPALALTAAALRARAAIVDTRPKDGDASSAAPLASGAVPEGQSPNPPDPSENPHAG